MKTKNIYWLFVLIIFIANACKRHTTTLTVESIACPNTYQLTDITFLNSDTGIIVGGEKYNVGAFYTTFDGGKTFTLHDSLSPWIINAVTTLSNNTYFITGLQGKVFRVSSAGIVLDSFQCTDSTGLYEDINSITAMSNDAAIAVGGVGKGLVFTNSNSLQNTWKPQSTDRVINDICMVNNTTGYCCGFGFVYQTTDGGVTWNQQNVLGDNFSSISFLDEQNGVLVGYSGDIFITHNAGANWKQLRNGSALFKVKYKFRDVKYVDEFTILAVGDNGTVYFSTNKGENWREVTSFTNANLNKIFMQNVHTLWVVGEIGGIYKIRL